MITSIIFDCDGVLVDTEPIMIKALLDLGEQYGAQMELDEAIKEFSGRQLLEVIKMLEEQSQVKFHENFELEFRELSYQRFKEGVEPVEGVEDLLKSLTIPFCVASSGPREKIILNLTLTGLIKYFPENHIFSSYDIGTWKPEPGIFLHALEQMNFKKSSTAIIEDSSSGVMAGISAGMQVYARQIGGNSSELEKLGAKVFNKMNELPSLLGLFKPL